MNLNHDCIMKREVFKELVNWKESKNLKPLILRGARQVGKSFLARKLGKEFDRFVEINFEETPQAIEFFLVPGDIRTIITKINAQSSSKIEEGKTLLFLDEIQQAPNAIIALRYFYEKMPNLHVLAAGSLIEFTLDEIGISVGRVRSLYLYPMSFSEFAIAVNKQGLSEYLNEFDHKNKMDSSFMIQYKQLLSEYFSVGGMPEAVKVWIESNDLNEVAQVHNDLIDTYQQDFSKYSRGKMVFNIEKVFNAIPKHIGEKFVYAKIDSNLRSRDLSPALELLAKAGIIHIVTHSSGNGVPLKAEEKSSLFKVIFLDIALAQKLLGIDQINWILDFDNTYTNKGNIVENFVGLELIKGQLANRKPVLHYWVREKKGSKAEVDYLVQKGEKVIAIEIKSGKRRNSRSLNLLLNEKQNIKNAYYLSLDNFSVHDRYINFPIFGTCKILIN